jgi:hypothetical protein
MLTQHRGRVAVGRSGPNYVSTVLYIVNPGTSRTYLPNKTMSGRLVY